MSKMKLTKKELMVLSKVLYGDPLNGNEDMRLRSTLQLKVKGLLAPKLKTLKTAKPMTKKEMKRILDQHMPKGKITNRTEFLGGIRDSINAALAN